MILSISVCICGAKRQMLVHVEQVFNRNRKFSKSLWYFIEYTVQNCTIIIQYTDTPHKINMYFLYIFSFITSRMLFFGNECTYLMNRTMLKCSWLIYFRIDIKLYNVLCTRTTNHIIIFNSKRKMVKNRQKNPLTKFRRKLFVLF